MLNQYFWWAALSSRFTSGAETKIGEDISRMDAVLAERAPSYVGEEVRLSIDDLRSAGTNSLILSVIEWYWHSIQPAQVLAPRQFLPRFATNLPY